MFMIVVLAYFLVGLAARKLYCQPITQLDDSFIVKVMDSSLAIHWLMLHDSSEFVPFKRVS